MIRRILMICVLALSALVTSCGGGKTDLAGVVSSLKRATTETKAAAADTFTQSGWYWNPSESGTGFFFEAQGDRGFTGFFMYEEGTGKAIWYTATGAFAANNDGTFSFTGTLQRYRGGQAATSTAYTAPVATNLGAVSIRFNGVNATVSLPGRTMSATRYDFAGISVAATISQPETGWYWNPLESGRGYAIEVQNNQAFVVMFHYNADGSPTWNTAQGNIAQGALTTQFNAFSGGQTLSGGWTRPSAAQSAGTIGLSFAGPCYGQVQLPGGSGVAAQRFGFGVAQSGDECKTLATGSADFSKAVGVGQESCDGISSPGNPYPCCNNTVASFGNGNCTWYASYRANAAWGSSFYALGSLGRPKFWWSNIESAQQRTSDRSAFVHRLTRSVAADGSAQPVVGSLALRTSGDFGHVAWVVATDLNAVPPTVTVDEQNCFHDNDQRLTGTGVGNSTRRKVYSASFFNQYVTLGANGNAPQLTLQSRTGSQVETGRPFTLTLDATDTDSNLVAVEVNWNDGSANPVERFNLNGRTGRAIFTRSFSTARAVNWSATAYDATGLSSNMLQGVFNVTSAPSICTGNGGASFTVGQTEAISCQPGENGGKSRVCQSGGTWSAISGSCVIPAVQCNGLLGRTFSFGEVEQLSCPSGQTGSQSRTCQAGGNWGATTGTCETPVAPQCVGTNGASYPIGATEVLACLAGQTGSQARVCQAGGVWGQVTGQCQTPPPAQCTGLTGQRYTVGERESIICPVGTSGSQSRLCGSGGVWGSISGSCTASQTVLQSATKTGDLARYYSCASGANQCVQAGITLRGLNFTGFSSVTFSWSGRSSGSSVFPAGNARIQQITDSSMVVWPTVFDQSDAVGTCYTWTASITKGGTTTPAVTLSSGQICRPSGV